MLTIVDNLATLEGREILPTPAGTTVADLVAEHRRESWGSLPVCVSVDGLRVDSESALPVAGDSHVLLAPDITGFALAAGFGAIAAAKAAAAAAFVTFASYAAGLAVAGVALYGLSRAYGRLVGTPGQPQEQGDEKSPTYAWLGPSTSYRTGVPKPLVFGDHEAPGQVISSDIVPFDEEPRKEVLQLIMMLSDSNCYGIGGITQDRDHLGALKGDSRLPLPAHIRVNGNTLTSPGAQAFVRLGTQYQAPLPEFQLASSALNVSAALNDKDEEAVHPIANPDVTVARIKIAFPGGLFEQQSGGQYVVETVRLRFEWRRSNGTGKWSYAKEITVSRMERDRFVVHVTLHLQGPGPYEVRTTRLTERRRPTLGFSQSAAVWESLISSLPGEFAYINQTILGLKIVANEQLQGQNVQLRVPVQGALLWTWDEVEGLRGERWGIVAPWQFEVGRNPAWVACWLLLHRKALGEIYGPTKVDWPAWRDFADYCDHAVDVNGTEEALHVFDGVLDATEPAFDALARVCRIARGVPILIGDKVSVRYSYRDAHGRGTNSVPARQMSFLVSSANVDPDSVQIAKHDTTRRPTILQIQYLNRDAGFEQDVLSVADPTALHDPLKLRPEPVVRETHSMFGITRTSAAFREAWFMHAINRLGDMTLQFVAGIDALPIQVGDIFGFEFDAIRPFADLPQQGMRTSSSGDDITSLAFDDEVTIVTGTKLKVQSKGRLTYEVDVTTPNGTYAAGVPITIASPVSVHAGAVIIMGTALKMEIPFEVTTTKLLPDMRREIQALKYVPAAHDLPDQSSDWDSGNAMAGTNFAASRIGPSVESLGVQSQGYGRARLTWVLPEGYIGQQVRVYVDQDSEPSLLGTTDSLSWDVEGLRPHEAHTLRVALQDRSGAFQQPELAASAEFVGDEFPPVDHYALAGLVATSESAGIRLRWDALDAHDLVGYEIRRGEHWFGAEVVTVVTDPHAWDDDAPFGTITYWIAGKYASGLYSRALPSVTVTHSAAWEAGVLTDLDGVAMGASTNCSYADGKLMLDAGEHVGTYESATLDVETTMQLVWSVYLNVRWHEPGFTLDDATFGLGSGEARWRTLDGREPTLALPGADFTYTLDTAAVADERGHSVLLGEVGQHVDVLIEIAFDSGGGFGAWQPYELAAAAAQATKVRLTLRRRSLDYEIEVSDLRVAGVAL